MLKTQSFAQKELDILISAVPDAVVKDFVPEIIALCEAFGNSGQSGGSAPYVASALSQTIKKLCLFQPIAPLQGTEIEWNDIGETLNKGEKTEEYQNNRCSAVFKKGNDDAYYLDAIIWKTQTGSTWNGSAKMTNGKIISSRQFIKEFPFEPKTFYIDVIEKEVEKDNWEFTIKDESQLIPVFEYFKETHD